MRWVTTIAVVCAVGCCTSAFCQSTPESAPPKTDIQGEGTLSDKLNKSNGVITPEGDVDPAIHKPAPATGTMPVVPPPGSPGGGSGVEPK